MYGRKAREIICLKRRIKKKRKKKYEKKKWEINRKEERTINGETKRNIGIENERSKIRKARQIEENKNMYKLNKNIRNNTHTHTHTTENKNEDKKKERQ